MAAWSYEVSLLVLKNWASVAHLYIVDRTRLDRINPLNT